MRTSRTLPLVVAALVTLSGCATEPIETEGREQSDVAPEPFDDGTPAPGDVDENVADPEREQLAFDGSVTASDHRTDGTHVVVDEAHIIGTEGWVVIHESTDGAPGGVIGKHNFNTALEDKAETDLRVELDEPLPAGEHRVWVMLHVDAGDVGTYEFPGPDEPLRVDGAVVQMPITITVADDG